MAIPSVRILWMKVLDTDDLSPESDFFEVGGNSLHAARLVALVEEHWGVALDLPDFYDHPTLGEMTAYVADQQSRRAAGQRTSPDL